MVNRLQVLAQEAEETPPPPPPSPSSKPEAAQAALLDILLLALDVLSKRAVVLTGHLLPIIALALGFALAWKIMDNPSVLQLGGMGIYAAFSLTMIFLRRK